VKCKDRRPGAAFCQGINTVQVICLFLDVTLDKALGFLVWGGVFYFLFSSAQNESMFAGKTFFF